MVYLFRRQIANQKPRRPGSALGRDVTPDALNAYWPQRPEPMTLRPMVGVGRCDVPSLPQAALSSPECRWQQQQQPFQHPEYATL